MKILVIANCQAGPIAKALDAVMKAQVKTDTIVVHESLGMDPAVVGERIVAADLVVHFPVSEGYKNNALSTKNVKAIAGDKSVLIPNIYYDGWHPDSSYVNYKSMRVFSPLGEYHSRLAMLSFVAQIPVSKVAAAFESESFFRNVGYLAQKQKSLEVFRKRHEICDIDFSPDLAEFAESASPEFLTFNHPSRRVMLRLAQKIAAHVGQPVFSQVGPGFLPEFFAGGPVLPISSSMIGNEYSNVVKKAGEFQFRTFSWFVERSVEHYRTIPMKIRSFYEENKEAFSVLHKEI